MGARSGNILPPQLLVEADGDVDALHDVGRGLGESATPLRVGGGIVWFDWFGGHGMALLTRRTLVAAAPTVLGALAARKPASASAPQIDLRPLTDITVAKTPRALPPVSFTTLDGARKTLADYAGHPIVLNFWATWCAPCVAELPELDELAAAGQFTVLAVSADHGGAAVVKPFAASHGLTHATILLDQGSDAVHRLDVAGFPTTLLIAPDGKLHGTLEGPAAWAGGTATLRRLLLS
jgi:thiol-disulfide isomerase/thioredoxin